MSLAPGRLAVGLAAVLALVVVAGCTPGSAGHSPATIVITSTQTSTRSPSTVTPPNFVPAAPSTAPGLGPDAPLPAGQVEGACPYIDTTTASDLEGNRILRTAVGSAQPVTCHFYFWCCDFHAVLDITPQTFASADDAYNAMVLTGKAGTEVTGVPGLVTGVDAVLYKTSFYGPDGAQDWACVFAKGTTMVIVRTNQTNVSLNARRIAETIAAEF